jgi:uncharacterized protein (TIGR00255 family)
MIRSMTGYGRAEAAGARLVVAAECKSLNHRTLDIAMRLPRSMAELELEARKLVQGALTRGRVEVSVTAATAAETARHALTVDILQAKEYEAAARRLAAELGLPGEPGLEWLLAQPGVLTRDEPESGREATPEAARATLDEQGALLREALRRALAELVARREAEGAALAAELRALLAGLEGHVQAMAARAPEAQARRAARLRERVQALLGGASLDEARMAQEIALLADRADITEELARLRTHLAEFARHLDTGGAVGRPLDFLIQEINREVNTVGSKADDLELSQAAIAAKSALEKLREQVQNLE